MKELYGINIRSIDGIYILNADPLGYGVSDDLGCMMENVRIELGYYDDPNEDK